MIPTNTEPSSYTPQYDIPFFNDVTYRYALQAPTDDPQIVMGADTPLLHAMIRGGEASIPPTRPMSMSALLAQAPCTPQVERYGYVSPGQGYISRTGDGLETPCPHTTDAAYNDSPCARTSNYQGYVNTYGNWSSPTTGEHPQCMQAQPDIPREMYGRTERYAYTVANNEPIIEEYCNCHQGANENSHYSGFYQPYFCENCSM
jgi:hypothetical protein